MIKKTHGNSYKSTYFLITHINVEIGDREIIAAYRIPGKKSNTNVLRS